MQFKELGIVHSCFKAKFGTPRQSLLVKNSTAYIEIHKKWEPVKCLRGLEEFSHAWVLFYFHENKNSMYRPIVRPPRLGRKGVGALATRSPLRPNPIGLSLVKIERIENERIYISGLDIIDGTPVLDIKPYINTYDSVEESRCAWVEELTQKEFKVEFTEEAVQDLQKINRQGLQENISDILKNDIRSRNDKSAKNAGKNLGFYFVDFNIIFRYRNDELTVLSIAKTN